MLIAVDWDRLSAGPASFDFANRRNEIQPALEDRKSPHRQAAIREVARVYSVYRELSTGTPFRWSSAPAHRKMLDAAGPAAFAMYSAGITPIHALQYMHRSEVLKFAGGLSFVPWTIYTSLKFIDAASAWKPQIGPAKTTHSFVASAATMSAGASLRARLAEQFGREAVDSISSDDDELWQLVGMVAQQAKTTPGLYIARSVKRFVEWEMSR